MKSVHDLKDKALLFGWITGLLMLISMIWIFSQPLQAYYLLRTVNSVFINNNDSRRLYAHIPVKGGGAGLMGYWYSIHNSADQMFIFTVFQDGILVPLGAVVSANGSVEDVVPLGAHASQVFDNIPKSILQMYIRRIETSGVPNREGNTR